MYGWVELSGARLNGVKKWMQERWRERSERAPNEMGLDGGTGVQCGCWVGGGAVPLCEVREERERCRVCSGSVVLGGFHMNRVGQSWNSSTRVKGLGILVEMTVKKEPIYISTVP